MSDTSKARKCPDLITKKIEHLINVVKSDLLLVAHTVSAIEDLQEAIVDAIDEARGGDENCPHESMRFDDDFGEWICTECGARGCAAGRHDPIGTPEDPLARICWKCGLDLDGDDDD